MCRTPDEVKFAGRAKLPGPSIRDDLQMIAAWIHHWQDDVKFGLRPTAASLAQAERIATRALSRSDI